MNKIDFKPRNLVEIIEAFERKEATGSVGIGLPGGFICYDAGALRRNPTNYIYDQLVQHHGAQGYAEKRKKIEYEVLHKQIEMEREMSEVHPATPEDFVGFLNSINRLAYLPVAIMSFKTPRQYSLDEIKEVNEDAQRFSAISRILEYGKKFLGDKKAPYLSNLCEHDTEALLQLQNIQMELAFNYRMIANANDKLEQSLRNIHKLMFNGEEVEVKI